MMHSVYALPVADMSHACPPSSTPDVLSQQIATMDSVSRSHHRGAGVQRPSGAMRVVKPSSTSNSPQARAARRRTMLADSNIARRRGQQLDHQTIQRHFQYSPPTMNLVEEPTKRSSRPVSWHPGCNMHLQQQQQQQQEQYITALQQQQQQQYNLSRQGTPYQLPIYPRAPQYVVPTPATVAVEDRCARYQTLPPTPAEYSAHNSPLSNFSPAVPTSMSVVGQAESPQHYFAPANWCQTQQPFYPNNAEYHGSPDAQEAFPSLPMEVMESWENMQYSGFQGGVTPPTPQDAPGAQHHEAVAVPSEESIPYEPLEGSDEEGEILVGMGLYDEPEKANDDPWLSNYRRTTSELLGTTYRRAGQGLKLEESWEPPASDDENDESNSDKDADGEEQEATEDDDDDQNWI